MATFLHNNQNNTPRAKPPQQGHSKESHGAHSSLHGKQEQQERLRVTQAIRQQQQTLNGGPGNRSLRKEANKHLQDAHKHEKEVHHHQEQVVARQKAAQSGLQRLQAVATQAAQQAVQRIRGGGGNAPAAGQAAPQQQQGQDQQQAAKSAMQAQPETAPVKELTTQIQKIPEGGADAAKSALAAKASEVAAGVGLGTGTSTDPAVLRKSFEFIPMPEPGDGFRPFQLQYTSEGGSNRAPFNLLQQMGLDAQTTMQIREASTVAEAAMSLPVWSLLLMRLNARVRALKKIGKFVSLPRLLKEILEQMEFSKDMGIIPEDMDLPEKSVVDKEAINPVTGMHSGVGVAFAE